GAGPGRGDGRRRRRGGSGRPAAGPRRTPGGPPGTRAVRDLLAQGGLAADGAGAGQRRSGVRGRGRVGRRRGVEVHVRVRGRPGPGHRRVQPAQPGQAHPGPGTATGRGLVTTRTARLSCHTLARHAVLTGDDYSLGTTRYGDASMQVLVTGGRSAGPRLTEFSGSGGRSPAPGTAGRWRRTAAPRRATPRAATRRRSGRAPPGRRGNRSWCGARRTRPRRAAPPCRC